ncbi:MAG: hypothetical protein PHE24_05540 [Patescibacteria group bacterium]|nr:hypothetical protein [Patescibacteria group bacterium]
MRYDQIKKPVIDPVIVINVDSQGHYYDKPGGSMQGYYSEGIYRFNETLWHEAPKYFVAGVVLHPDIQLSGPKRYDISDVEQWRHPDDEPGVGFVDANEMYAYLVKNRMMESQLGFFDLWAIRAKGFLFFEKYFGDKTILAWKSVYRYYHDDFAHPPGFWKPDYGPQRRYNHLCVPCLYAGFVLGVGSYSSLNSWGGPGETLPQNHVSLRFKR